LKREYLKNGLITALAFVCVGARVVPGAKKPGPVYKAATSLVTIPRIDSIVTAAVTPPSAAAKPLAAKTAAAVQTLASVVRPLSHPKALETAFKSYFAYTTAHPDEVKKPFLYFVDYGLPSTEPRGYIFDMSSLSVVEGPFTVAHGRGSSTSQYGVPTRFSNAPGSAMTSLGLYLAEGLYQFVGHTGGHTYSSVGLRLEGVTPGYNDKALARGVVAHGAPYVSASKAGRSEGCPAMEPQRAQRVLPELANGGMVFLFAPEADLLASASDD
jgi:hypothetical protein